MWLVSVLNQEAGRVKSHSHRCASCDQDAMSQASRLPNTVRTEYVHSLSTATVAIPHTHLVESIP